MPDFHVTFRDLLHAVNLRHGTKGFTSLPKEGVLRNFSPWKIRRLRPGLNQRTWVPKASTEAAGTKGKKMGSFRLLSLYMRNKTHRYSLKRMLIGRQGRSERVEGTSLSTGCKERSNSKVIEPKVEFLRRCKLLQHIFIILFMLPKIIEANHNLLLVIYVIPTMYNKIPLIRHPIIRKN